MDNNGLRLDSFFVLEGRGQEIPLTPALDTRPAFIIGSDARAQLQLADAAVAPAHAVVTRKDEVYCIAPRFPQQVVQVNGQRITAPVRLSPGDVVQIGATILRFNQAERPVTAAPPAMPSAIQITAPPPVRPAAIAPVAQRLAPSLASAAPPVIHYPRAVQATNTTSIGSVLLGVVTLVAIVGFLGYNFVATSAMPEQVAIPVDFAYRDGNVTVVMFGADWCVPCKQQMPILNDVASDFRGDAYVQHVDIDRRANRALVEKYGVSATPTLLILNDQGEVSTQFIGLTQAAALRQAIQQALTESTGTAAVR